MAAWQNFFKPKKQNPAEYQRRKRPPSRPGPSMGSGYSMTGNPGGGMAGHATEDAMRGLSFTRNMAVWKKEEDARRKHNDARVKGKRYSSP